MPELSENDVNRKLLVEVEAALKGKEERQANIKSSIVGLKKKMIEHVDKCLWDLAQDVLNQTHKLSVDAEAADADVVAAQARVDGLKVAIVRADEKARLAAMPPPYKPYAPEAIQVTAPVVAPAVAPAPAPEAAE